MDLTAMEFDILLTFLRAAGTVVSREYLVTQVLGRKFHPFDRSIDTHISNLRRKLGDLVDTGQRIQAIRSVGYVYASPPAAKRQD